VRKSGINAIVGVAAIYGVAASNAFAAGSASVVEFEDYGKDPVCVSMLIDGNGGKT